MHGVKDHVSGHNYPMADDEDIIAGDGSTADDGESIFGELDPLVDPEDTVREDSEFEEELDEQYEQQFEYGTTWLFDFPSGRFVVSGSGQIPTVSDEDAFAQWCMIALHTERFMATVFSEAIGIEIEDIIREDIPREVAPSTLEERISEALAVHNRFSRIDNFESEFLDNGTLSLSFDIETTSGSAVPIDTELNILNG